jgi:Virulence-associated protein and related proteins
MTTAKVFKNGGSQAIRLPKEFRVKSKKVYLKKTNEGFIVTEIDPWKVCFQACQELSDDFMKARIQPLEQRRNQHRK